MIKKLIYLHCALIMYSCSNKNNDCTELFRNIYLIYFNKDDVEDMKIIEKSKDGIVVKNDRNFSFVELEDRSIRTYHITLENNISDKDNTLIFILNNEKYELTNITTKIVERKTMISTVYDCVIDTYIINGVQYKKEYLEIEKIE